MNHPEECRHPFLPRQSPPLRHEICCGSKTQALLRHREGEAISGFSLSGNRGTPLLWSKPSGVRPRARGPRLRQCHNPDEPRRGAVFHPTTKVEGRCIGRGFDQSNPAGLHHPDANSRLESAPQLLSSRISPLLRSRSGCLRGFCPWSCDLAKEDPTDPDYLQSAFPDPASC